MALHPAENRGYRELMLTAEEARTRLRRIGGHLDLEQRAVADKGYEAISEMLVALKPALAEHDLHGEIAARGTGARIGTVRAEILDRFLEKNQALRFAVDDVEHVTTLLAYMAAVSTSRGQEEPARALPHVGAKAPSPGERPSQGRGRARLESRRRDRATRPTADRQGGCTDCGRTGTVGEAVDKAVATVKEKTPFFDGSSSNGDDTPSETAEEPKKRKGLFRRG